MFNLLYPLFFQIPTSTPNPGETSPIDLSKPFDVIVFIILPIVIIVFYIFWRRSKKQDNKR